VRVVLTGGGTGGHIYPALSVARRLQGEELLYVGTAEGPEATIVPTAGVPFRAVPSRKLSRRPTPGAAVALAVSAWGIVKAAAMLRAWRPDAVLGTGGYASAAVMFAAGLLRIPSVVHEANARPGRVNRLLARLCTRVAITFPETADYFPREKTVLTGLPVRDDLLVSADPTPARSRYSLDPKLPTLLVSGGSGGARSLNRAVLDALPELGAMGVQVVHQAGKGLIEEVLAEVGTPSALYHPVPYVDDMPGLMAAATVILCRGGSSTLSEVTVLGLPAIVVPYPFAVDDHQSSNARSLEAAGAAVWVKDAELDGARLVTELRALLEDPPRLERMREASRAAGKPEATAKVVEILRAVARKH
jgi:UDP-N-acetylglucosamine--N-acetylmuramyl-(pentapeptide) pyrophosphoryl-undecaprenol N-acetylglucosamine transferase